VVAVLPSSTCSQQVSRLFICTWSHSDTPQSVGLLWTRDRLVTETSTWQHKHSQNTNIHAPVGFEPTIPASARPQTYALNRPAIGIGVAEYMKGICVNETNICNSLWLPKVRSSVYPPNDCTQKDKQKRSSIDHGRIVCHFMEMWITFVSLVNIMLIKFISLFLHNTKGRS
jgi:hypothetical protein